jgi:UDP-glucose 4-epimerase
MKILVTGGAGFIGSHTVVELIKNKFHPIIVDDLRNSKGFIIDNINKITGKKIPYYAIDFGDKLKLSEVFKKEKPEGIIHFAADKAVNESINNPLKYYNNNLSNLVALLSLVDKFKVKSFVFSSSCTVYGLPEKIPVSESAPIKEAASPYGFTKQVGEKILSDFFKTNPNSSLAHLRYFNPIGAHPSGLIGELPIGLPSNLIPYVTQTAIGKRDCLTIHGNDYNTEDGTCIRDYIHVVDLASAHVLTLNHLFENSENLILNVGTGNGSSVLKIVNKFQEVNNIKLKYKFGPRRSGDVPVMYADNSLICEKINWSAKFSLDDCLVHSWKWENNLGLSK